MMYKKGVVSNAEILPIATKEELLKVSESFKKAKAETRKTKEPNGNQPLTKERVLKGVDMFVESNKELLKKL